MKKKPKDEFADVRQEMGERENGRKFKITEAKNAYPKVKKAWDFGRFDTKEKIDTSRLTARRKKGK